MNGKRRLWPGFIAGMCVAAAAARVDQLGHPHLAVALIGVAAVVVSVLDLCARKVSQ